MFASLSLRAAALIAALVLAPPAAAQNAEPYFASLKFEETNGRIGPSFDHPVRWKYRRAGLPVLVLEESGGLWMRVADPEGDVVWVYSNGVSKARTAIVTDGPPADLRRETSADSPLRAQLSPGLVVEVARCADGRCRVKTGAVAGFVAADRLWGATGKDAARRAAELH
ncbi:MAG: SH3 domain-containing protein [Pseudomonadota bacterium]